ncbi:MAG: hypothetical protein M1823_001007 [Watsoniomyces obsoletus]|nr:MAG: hypothetical protein M1823_001007 [Watsoniomyces obsoletus]
MANRPSPIAALAGMHTAGIYADMTVDGPVIGDLVVIIDKAKNLPNRKTIGKQDPYCAARLGKEAKKTETDKRGGQTPRWDQELRFVVHDSPDYRQLKVSVFNDDKKTDLIGETWVKLEDVLHRGGGRMDGWHSLQFKGRYAGEIRIELTYYDTRPREEPAPDRQREKEKEESKTRRSPDARTTLSGPRQPQQVPRRPLPTDPAQSSRSVPLDSAYPAPLRHSQSREQSHHAHRPSYHSGNGTERVPPTTTPPVMTEEPMPLAYGTRESVSRGSNGQLQYGHSPGPPPNQYESTFEPNQAPVHPQYHREHEPEPQHHPIHTGSQHGLPHPPHQLPYQPYQGYREYNDTCRPRSRREASPEAPSPLSSNPPTSQAYDAAPPPIRHHHSAPDYRQQPTSTAPYPVQDEVIEPRHPVIPPHVSAQPRHYSHDGGYQDEARAQQPYVEEEEEEEDVPPPPPVHRSNTDLYMSSHGSAGGYHYSRTPPAASQYSPAASGSVSVPGRDRNDEQQVQYATSPSSRGDSAYSRPTHAAAPTPSSYENSPRPMQPGPSPNMYREHRQSMPPSLVPGYDPRPQSESPTRTRRPTEESSRWDASVIPHHALPPTQPAPSRYHRPHASQPDVAPRAAPAAFDPMEHQRSSRGATPIVKSTTASPDPLRIPRKSVSPRPVSTIEGPTMSQTPFSPDAFDAFNPHARSPTIMKDAGTNRHRSPGTEDGPSRSHEDPSSFDEPIIGEDGREIDPSDHLPRQIWAPEPERKTPTKPATSSMETRTRPTPLGAQPMPPSGRRLPRESPGRPHSMSTPGYAYGSEPATPEHSRRVRLQKRDHEMVPNSSPLGEQHRQHRSTYSTPRSLPRTSTNEQRPMPDRDDYSGRGGGGGGSPYSSSYGNGGQMHSSMGGGGGGLGAGGGAPPPIPAKVPMNGGAGGGRQDDYSALSEELRSIDIGSGSTGRRTTRRGHY